MVLWKYYIENVLYFQFGIIIREGTMKEAEAHHHIIETIVNR